jgi:hypothetical protein
MRSLVLAEPATALRWDDRLAACFCSSASYSLALCVCDTVWLLLWQQQQCGGQCGV